jgi:hypothetical protein
MAKEDVIEMLRVAVEIRGCFQSQGICNYTRVHRR